MKTIYLDHNATTPIRPEVLEAMMPFLKDEFGNPSSLHQLGQKSRKAVEEARAKLAAFIGADDPNEIIFTSGGTESDNLAIKGTAVARGKPLSKVTTSTVEHSAVRRVLFQLEKSGWCQVSKIPVTSAGCLDKSARETHLSPDTDLVTLMLVNNETGVIQPVEEIFIAAREKGVTIHTDAVQAAGRIPIDVNQLGVDLLSLSGHKLGAPKGIGILYVRKGTRLEALIHGGSQEKNRRGGTENVAAIVGLGVAADLAREELSAAPRRIEPLRNLLEKEILSQIPKTAVNGAGATRVCNTTNILFEFTDNTQMVMALDMKGISVSNGSACASGNPEPSHVLLAMGLPQDKAHASIRFSLGSDTTKEDIETAIPLIVTTVQQIRSNHPLWKEK